jgi:hypothetical protein
LVCTPYATSTAVTLPNTAITTRSCADDGFPATWTRTAAGSCIAPVVATAPATTGVTVGAACTTSAGSAGYYGYVSGSANIDCIAYTTATIAPTTASTTAATTATTTPTLGSACTQGGVTGTWGYVAGSASLYCVASPTYPTATTTAATLAPTMATISPNQVGQWAYNTGDGTANTSCNYNGTMRCGWYYTATAGTYTMGPPQP